MAERTPPFAGFEWMIAWRYLRARRAEGGVSVMTWISLVGIALGVMALVAIVDPLYFGRLAKRRWLSAATSAISRSRSQLSAAYCSTRYAWMATHDRPVP